MRHYLRQEPGAATPLARIREGGGRKGHPYLDIIRKAFKYRVYPNAQQEKGLAIQFGHARFVYNHFLAVRQDHYKAHKEDEGKK